MAVRIYPDADVCLCNGKGSVSQTEHYGDGGGQYVTSLCKCRRDLPRRDGKVRWWSCDTPKVWKWSDSLDWIHVRVTATRELPVSEDNYPLRRTADNAYMCASVHITRDGDRFLGSDIVREYARWLLKTADEIDEYDAVAPGGEG